MYACSNEADYDKNSKRLTQRNRQHLNFLMTGETKDEEENFAINIVGKYIMCELKRLCNYNCLCNYLAVNAD